MARLKHSSSVLLDIYVPVAVSEGWTLVRLAAECHCGRDAARSALRRYRDVIRQQTQGELEKQCLSVVEEAQRARDFALVTLQRHAALVDRMMAQMEEGGEFEIADLAKLIRLSLEHFKLVELVTGQDVVKAVAVKHGKKPDETPVSWDGVQALMETLA